MFGKIFSNLVRGALQSASQSKRKPKKSIWTTDVSNLLEDDSKPSPAHGRRKIPAWLEELWHQNENTKGINEIVPDWYWDDPTARQIERLRAEGFQAPHRATKGQISDLIGLTNPPDSEDYEVVKFFKAKPPARNQTAYRYEAAILMSDSEKAATWQARPPSSYTKFFFKLIDQKIPEGATEESATTLMDEIIEELRESSNPKLEAWYALVNLREDISDMEEIRTPSLSQLHKACNLLTEQNLTWEELSEDPDLVTEKLIELYPALNRN